MVILLLFVLYASLLKEVYGNVTTFLELVYTN